MSVKELKNEELKKMSNSYHDFDEDGSEVLRDGNRPRSNNHKKFGIIV